MRLVFIGCVKFSYAALEMVIKETKAEVVGVITKNESKFNADFASLEPLAKKYKIPFMIAENNDQEQMYQWIKELNPDVIYCFGWSYLLNKKMLEIPKLGVIGYHPTKLPKNRGRHPIIWTLVLGLKETASTFFFMDEGADSGDILSQEVLPVLETDDANTLYNKLITTALQQIKTFTHQLMDNTYQRIPQDHDQANYWRKRNKEDGLINWRMSAKTIYNLVRALTKPYVGAHCLYRNREVKVWKTQIDQHYFNQEEILHIEPGKVLKVERNHIYVKCGEGVLILVEHELFPLPKEGEYL